MLEKLWVTLAAVTLTFGWAAGYAWAQGDLGPSHDTSAVSQPTRVAVAPGVHGYGNATPMPSPEATPTPTPEPAKRARPKTRQRAAVSGTYVPSGQSLTVPADPGTDYGTDPGYGTGTTGTDTAPAPAAGAAPGNPATPGSPTEFTMATFNLLGSSHTRAGGASPGMASGPTRLLGALQVLAQHQISVVGFQEFQPDQRAAFQRQAQGWAMYPGLSMGRRAGENSVAWRTEVWDMVKPGLVDIPYFNGRIRPMPYVLLRNKQTGAQVYVSTFHNPANIGGNMQRFRTEATTREIALFNRLEDTGIPQLVTGDMNERTEYFCRVTGSTPLKAAAGGTSVGGCKPPKHPQIDWIFGSPTVAFSGYTVDRSPLVRRTTDHPVVVAHVTLNPR